MKKFISLLLICIMLISIMPNIAFAVSSEASVNATKAFSWNFTTNAQNGTLPTAVSWGDYRACFMTFEIPEEILNYKDKDALIEATLTASMTFNNGRVSGQVPVVTIISADPDLIDAISLTGGGATSDVLKSSWQNGKVLCEFDTLNNDISPVMDLTDIVKSSNGKIGLYITCRSEDGYLKTNGIVNFNSPVLNFTATELDEEYYFNNINLPYNLEDGYKLPVTVLGKEVTWSEEEIKAEEKSVCKTLSATIDGKTKDFDVMIMGKEDNFILAYTTDEDAVVGKSMHLAVKTDEGWEEVNFGIGVLFAEADLNDGTVAGTTKVLDKPYVYRKENGKIGIAARCETLSGVEDDYLTLWETEDLVHFDVVGTAKTVDGYETTSRVVIDGFEGASCVFPVTDDEFEFITKKLGEVKNISVESVVVRTEVGKAVESLPMLTANYSDGSTAEIPVIWNEAELNAIDFSRSGVYHVSGEAVVSEYESPFAYGEADPVVYKYNDKYYFIATNETGGQVDLYIREGDTIEEAAAAEEVLIFEHTSSGDHSGCNWAPELHVINGDLYCLFASSTTGSWNAVQSRIMKCTGDPMNINDWEAPVRVSRKDGTNLISEGITLDMTYFEANGKHYYAWAERPITALGNGNSYIVIAEMNPEDPYKITSDPQIIRMPNYGWDRFTTTVDEGPYVLKHDGKLYMTFSGSGCDNTYCLGILTADENADLLNPDSWKCSNYPNFASAHIMGEYGPGHNSFVKDEYGRDVIVYHMKPDGGTRSATAKTIHYAFDGTPIFYMTPERYLKSEYRQVTASIYVRDEGMSDEEFEVESIVSNIKIPNSDNIKEHIYLPTEIDGATVTWQSNNNAVKNDGVVIRGSAGVNVKLTATVTKNKVSATREFNLTVKAKAEEKEKVGYIYAYFRGSVNGEKEVQQIHLAISDDGLNWRDLNGNFPVIESNLGTKGLRDPYIIRSYEGDKFYLMATDLDASDSGQWDSYGNNGSKSLMFWESDDLVNWSEQRMIKVSDENMGCTWAPEAIYDEETKQYVIYWASSVLNEGGKKSVFYATTRDFVTFSEPEVFVDGSKEFTVIDTSMIRGDDQRYYRFTKKEANNSVFMEVSDSVLGEYETVESNITDITGVEGPAIFKMIDGKYCLMLDGYTGANAGVGFFPSVTDDLASGQFTRLTEGFKMPTGAKHGVMLAVTKDEYDAIMEKWGPLPEDDNVLEYDFEEAGNLNLYGNAKVENGVLILDGTNGTYANLGNGIFDRREKFTVSMDIYNETEDGFFFTFAIGDTEQDYLFLRTRKDQIRFAHTITSHPYEEGADIVAIDNVNKWNNYTITGDGETLKLYVDGVFLGEAKTTKTLYHLGNNLSVNLGKSTYSGDKYFKGKFDNVKIYNRALSADEVMELNGGAEQYIQSDIDTVTIFNPNEITCDLMLPEKGEKSSVPFVWKSSDTSIVTDDGKVTRGEEDKKVTMTATLALGETVATKEIEITVLKEEEDSAYLFAYFTSRGGEQEKLFYGVSKDGYNFRALNGGESVLTSSLGTGHIRDPFVMKGEDGYYYIIATDMNSALGWSSNYATVVFKTPDLINIVDAEWINYREFPSAAGCTRAWAPQAIWCPEKEAYMVYLAMSIPSDPYETVMYRHYATDLCDASTYTDVELMLDEPVGTGAGAIDGDIIYDKFHNEYIMYYDGKRVARADSISGQWTHAETKYSDGQLPMVTNNGYSMAVEGSNIWQIIGEDKWIIAADGTAFNGGCYAVVETTDFENYTQLWESDGAYSFDFAPRHGYVIPISERELSKLMDYYGEVQFPEKKVYELNVDLSKKGVNISPDMYGVFYEDINYAADGGLYSEVIENRSFEAAHCNPDRGESYTKIPSSGWMVSTTAEYLSEYPLNENNTTYMRLKANKGDWIKNECYGGFNAKKGEKYAVSFFARGSYTDEVTVAIVEGDLVLGSTNITVGSEAFERYEGEVVIKTPSENASVMLIFNASGTIEMDMISVMSQDTFNGRNNGLRKDIVQMLYDMHPSFMRFPGGCVVEGYYLNNRYDWKASIGPVEERKENWNRWQTGANAYDYCQSLGLGFYEYFLLCEDIGAKPLPVVGVGIACQYQSGEVSSWDDLYNIYIQDAIDLIEFANGDPEENEWAKIRAEMGHPEPFNLEYLGIGNEQWYTDNNRFFERYEAFEEEIHKLYPDIKLISTSGPSADGVHYDNAWNWLRTHNGEENFTYAVDEHYYKAPEWFLENINRYDRYERDGFSVFAGEYAANGTYGNTLYSAIAEAAYMTGLEKNADIVKMASYAPLLAKTNYNQWNPNLIWFNNSSVYGSPDYYVQRIYSENKGSYTVESEVTIQGEKKIYNAGVGTWSTSAEFKDITITNLETGEESNLELTTSTLGTWSVTDGIVSQSDTGVNGAYYFGNVNCENYTLRLKARKTGGYEGFLIPVHYVDENNCIFWNIAGWSNTNHAVQRVVNGSKSTITGYVGGSIENNTWYDVEVTIENNWMYCYLNGELIHKVNVALTEGPVYSTVSVDENSGDIILKMVNTSNVKETLDINLENADYIASEATEIILTSRSMDAKNSHDNPLNVTENEGVFEGASDSFEYEIDALSFVVLRLHTKENYVKDVDCVVVSSAEELPKVVTVTLSDGSKEERSVNWRKATDGAYFYSGVYSVEGTVEETNLYATAKVVAIEENSMMFIDDTHAAFKAVNAKAYIACYNEEGELVTSVYKAVNGTEVIEFEKVGGKVKLMLWNEGMEPLCKAIELND